MSCITDQKIIKHEGQCINRATWKYCPYWRVLKGSNGTIISRMCTLYDKEKLGYESLSECDRDYGLTYNGFPT